MQVKVVEDEPTTSYVDGSDASWKSLFLYEMQKMEMCLCSFNSKY